MPKIVRLKTPQDDIVQALEAVLEKVKQGEALNFIFACKCPDGNIATSWHNADIGERNELISHMQTDLMFAVVESNFY